jgi:inosine/xanthosine triphosphate pyrophosphatase family protein
MSGAEMPLELKNAVSHRGKAMRALIARLNELREHGR